MHKDAGILVIALRDDLDVPAECRTGIAPDSSSVPKAATPACRANG